MDERKKLTTDPSRDPHSRTPEDIAREVGAEASSRVSDLGRRGRDLADRQRSAAARRLDGVADGLRAAARHAGDGGEENRWLATPASELADRLEQVAGYLSDNDIRAVFGDAERFARRRPQLFLSGAFLLGLAAGRFVRSSSPEHDEDNPRPNVPRQEPPGAPRATRTSAGSFELREGRT